MFSAACVIPFVTRPALAGNLGDKATYVSPSFLRARRSDVNAEMRLHLPFGQQSYFVVVPETECSGREVEGSLLYTAGGICAFVARVASRPLGAY